MTHSETSDLGYDISFVLLGKRLPQIQWFKIFMYYLTIPQVRSPDRLKQDLCLWYPKTKIMMSVQLEKKILSQVYQVAVTKIHRLSVFKQQKLIFSRFWKPVVQDLLSGEVVSLDASLVRFQMAIFPCLHLVFLSCMFVY